MDSSILINISTDEKMEKDKIEDFEINEENEDKNISEDTGMVNRGTVTITLPDGINYSDGKSAYADKIYKTLKLKSKSTLPYHSRYFDYNDNNTCGSTAAAIFTYYYFDHVSKSYIKDNSYKKGDEKSQRKLVKDTKG